jgi:hypothetical protein
MSNLQTPPQGLFAAADSFYKLHMFLLLFFKLVDCLLSLSLSLYLSFLRYGTTIILCGGGGHFRFGGYGHAGNGSGSSRLQVGNGNFFYLVGHGVT